MRLNGEGSSNTFDDLRVPMRELSSSDMAFRMPRVFKADCEVIYEKNGLCNYSKYFMPRGNFFRAPGGETPPSRQPLKRNQSYLYGTLLG